MPPEKKAAKKAAKKPPAPAQPAPHEDVAKDARRAYEHLGRVEALHPSLDPHAAAEVSTLTQLAAHLLVARHTKEAADLLRAAEHLSFAALASPKRDTHVDPQLLGAITREFDGKLEKADEHWAKHREHHPSLEPLFDSITRRAQRSCSAGAFRQALELSRAAEALAHVHLREAVQLSAGTATQHQLPA